ncbi:MAG: rhomboid family intramembrane serine protease [Thermoproteota archaeon]
MYTNSTRYMPTYLIIGLNLTVYIFTAFFSGNPVEIDHLLIQRWGQYNLFVLNGRVWQLFTSLFVHTNSVHLLGNLFFLLIFGLRAEEFFAIYEYLAIYLLSGLAGNLLTLLFGPLMISTGASGAIFGLFGAGTIYIRHTFGKSIIGALVYSFFLLIINSGRNVNNLAHLGGLITGLLIGYTLATRRRWEDY